jgi:hypothetical protein
VNGGRKEGNREAGQPQFVLNKRSNVSWSLTLRVNIDRRYLRTGC